MNKIFQHTHMHDHVPIKIQFISINLMLLFTFFSPPINCDLCRVQSKQQPKYKYEQTENWFEKCTINQKCEKLHSCLLASDERKFALFLFLNSELEKKKSRLTANKHFECANKALFTTNSIAWWLGFWWKRKWWFVMGKLEQ